MRAESEADFWRFHICLVVRRNTKNSENSEFREFNFKKNKSDVDKKTNVFLWAPATPPIQEGST